MQFDKPYYAFVAGEVSPELFARTDLAKFDLGVAKAKNFFVDYRGGMVSRPGTEYNTSRQCSFYRHCARVRHW